MSPNRWLQNELRKWTSTLKKLRGEGKTNEQFEIMVNNLTLEELIAAKLELSSKTLGTPLYGLPIWKHMNEITQEAVLMFAISVTSNPIEAATYLGLKPYDFKKLVKKYKLYTYFNLAYDEQVKAKRAARKAAEAQNGTNEKSETGSG